MPPALIVATGLLFLALAISVVSDLRSRRIYNWVTYPGMGLGLALHAAAGWGQELPVWAAFGWKSSAAGLALGFGVFLLAFLTGGMGEGDVKLMGAVGALAGVQVAAAALVTVTFCGGILAVAVLVYKGRLWGTLRGMARDAGAAVGLARRAERHGFAGPRAEAQPEQTTERPRIYVPYGVAIAAGTLWAFLWVGSLR
jgi:prepilin peptidase CpaA